MANLERALRLIKELEGVARRVQHELFQLKILKKCEIQQLSDAVDKIPDYEATLMDIEEEPDEPDSV